MVSKLIKNSGSISTKPENLGKEFGLSGSSYKLSEIQAQAILDLRLQRLTGLEQDNLVAEYEEILGEINNLQAILEEPDKLKK